MATKVRPLGDKVLVKRDEAGDKTESGIFLPESAKEKPKLGTVQAVGTGSINTETGERIPLSIKKGDKVLFNTYSGTEVKIDKDTLLIMSESEVLAVIDD